jgi:hypothetical protein
MIGKLVGAFVGDKLAKQTSQFGGATGAVIGVAAASVLRRMSLPMMIVLGAGGYLAKKAIDRSRDKQPDPQPVNTATTPPANPAANATPDAPAVPLNAEAD